jgi:hypothetical protein
VPRALWWRWYSWTASQSPVHPCEWRYAKHLTEHADESGRIVDIAAAIEGYAHWHHVSTRTGWTDHARVEARGRLREKLTPTCGRKAVYQLCVDPAELDMDAMPVELVHEFGRLFGLPIGDEEEHQDDVAGDTEPPQPPPGDEHQEHDEERELDLGPVPGSLAHQHRYLADCEVSRLGGASQRCRWSTVSCGRLHTRRIPKRLFSPSLCDRPSHQVRPRSQGKISSEEKAAAESIMRRCWPSWIAQRDIDQHGPPLSRTEWVELVPLVVYALRYADHPGDIRDELTDRIASARHLPTLLAFRCRRLIRRGWYHAAPSPRPPEPAIAEARRQAELAVQVGRATVERAAGLLDELRADLVDKRPAMPARPTPAPLVTAWATEAEPVTTGSSGPSAADEQRLRYAHALQRARREAADQHRR